MEFYGSIDLVSGSVTASVFSGSFVGNAEGLYNIQASGVTGLNLSQIANGANTASISSNGFNVNTNTSITGSVNVSGTIVSQTTSLVSASAQVQITGTTGYSTFSSSIATTDLNQENRLTSIENSYAITGSNTFKGTQNISGSIIPTIDNAFDLGSPTYQWRDVYISSGSLYIDGTKVLGSTAQELTITTDNGQSLKLLEGTTDSIILQVADGDIELKSSADGDILLDPTNGKIMLKGPIEILNGNKIQSSVGGTPVVFANDIVVSGSIDLTGTIEGINLTDLSSSLNGRIGSLESGNTSLNSFTSSASSRLNSLETESGSVRTTFNSHTSSANGRLTSIESITGSVNTRLSSIETTTGSLLSTNTTQNGRLDSLETTSGSILSTNTTQNSRLSSIEVKTGSYATTGSNIFQGTQTITGSLYISQDLIVAGSSSIQNISSSIVNIADNIITVNALNPSIRFGGLAVIDSGSSPQVSGSMLFDSVNNQWIFIHQNQSAITSSILIMGPQTFNDVGNESYPTTNRILKSVNAEHLGDSNITDTGTKVSINSNTEVTGTLKITGEITSAFSSGDEGGQINLATPQTNTTLVGGIAIDVYQNRLRFFEQGGTARGGYFDISSLSAGASTNLMGTAATASYVEYTNVANKPTLVSGSSQITFSGLSGVPSGLISGSSQVVYSGISGTPSGIVSGSSQITFSGISGLPTLVSGSSQISFGSISNVPSGLVSGSSQIDLTSTTNYSSGIKTRLNTEGVISGSAQVTLSSTTGFGTYLNQAVLTTSTPTFSTVTATTFTGALSGNATTATSLASMNISQFTNNSAYIKVNDQTYFGINNTSSSSGNGISLYGSYSGGEMNYGIMFAGTPTFGTHGSVTGDWATYFTMNPDNTRGWIFRKNGTANVASISAGGNANFSGTITASNLSGTNTGDQTNVSGYAQYLTTNAYTSGYLVVGGNYSNNAYNSLDGVRLMFGAGNADAIGNYYIGTNFENFGGNYTKLDLRWHTGIRMGSQQSYGGVRIFDSEDLGTRLFSVGEGDTNVRITNTLRIGGLLLRTAAGQGWLSGGYGTYEDSTTTGAIYSIGGSYYPTSTSFNNMHGVGYTHTNSSLLPTGPGTNGWGFYVLTNGTPNVWLGAEGPSWFAYNINPKTNGGASLGNSSYRWANVYTQDLHLSNDGKEGGNEIDGTTGDWTIQEGQENLYIINHKNGKKFKINLTEIV